MAADAPGRSTEEVKAGARLRLGAAVGLFSAVFALALPWVLLLAGSRSVGMLALSANFLKLVDGLAVIGTFGFLVMFFLYHRAFSHLRHIDPSLRAAVILCTLGTVGSLVLTIVVAWLLGGTGALSHCLGGRATDAYACVRGRSPALAWLAVTGFWLTWVGGVGIVVGLLPSAHHYGRGALTVAGSLYAVLLVLLLVPVIALLYLVPGLAYAGLLATLAALVAPVLVLAGARQRNGRPGPTG